MPATTTRGYPYPVGGDPIDVAGDVQRLAQSIDTDVTAVASSGGAPIDAWPVGSVYIAVDAVSPAVKFGGGTWVAFATGRMLIGIDPADSQMSVAEQTGGAKTKTLGAAELPVHNHAMAHTHPIAHTHTINHDHGSITATTASAGGHAHEPAAGSSASFWSTATSGYTHDLADPAAPNKDSKYGATTATAGAHTHSVAVNLPSYAGSSGAASTPNSGGVSTPNTSNAGSGTAFSLLNPFIVTYMWKRTA